MNNDGRNQSGRNAEKGVEGIRDILGGRTEKTWGKMELPFNWFAVFFITELSCSS